MSHTNETTYYGLPQFIGTDIINPLTDTNGAYSAIDTALHDVAAVAGQAETVAGQASDDVSTMDARVTAVESSVQTMDEDIENISKAVAPTFVTTASYQSGDYVMYNGKRYRFTATHVAGAWTGADAVEAPCSTEDKRAFTAINNINSQLDGRLIRSAEQLYTIAANPSETAESRFLKLLNQAKTIWDNKPANVADVIIDGIDNIGFYYLPINGSMENLINNNIPMAIMCMKTGFPASGQIMRSLLEYSFQWTSNNEWAVSGVRYDTTYTGAVGGVITETVNALYNYGLSTDSSNKPAIMAWHYEYEYDA